MKKPYAVLLFGPTAVGKTSLLERIFADKAEIISADSVQIYRGLDIGSAKPSLETRNRIPHHLIDILDPQEQYAVGAFVQSAEDLIRSISARGVIPVVSGGTAFYFRNLAYGLPSAPPADQEIRRKVENECALHGLEKMFQRLKQVDPESAARISPTDRYRILRALEVYEVSGKPLSNFAVPQVLRKDINLLILGLRRERSELYSRINERVDLMFREGLVQEVIKLRRQGCSEKDPGMQGIGYREFFTASYNGCLRVKDIAALIKQNSRHYAKRQMTFFNSIHGAAWAHPDDEEKIRLLICNFLSEIR